MRDPARIPDLCRLLQRAWERSPDQRLGQLVVNAIAPQSPCPAVFYAEDSRVRRGLERLARDGAAEPELPSHREAVIGWEQVGEPPPATVILTNTRLGTFEVGIYLCQVLEVAFGGEYRSGSLGNPDADAMMRHLAVLIVRTQPDVVLLDLSSLRYAWGDRLLGVFELIQRSDPDHPLGVTVLGGPDSAPALRSLGLTVHTDAPRALDDAMRQAVARSRDIG
jgi:hypothetical protein